MRGSLKVPQRERHQKKHGANLAIYAVFSVRSTIPRKDGGADRSRTCDPHNAIVVLYQLSYDPNRTRG